ncbi:MAG: hypothetical protein B6226_00165 [Candidatus Cloacimonetes bacterium 4572_65]|nr:MAG: hypothetical protein B6226_00165 [Candidatus Cloacimonetes bacterium 4572_65]
MEEELGRALKKAKYIALKYVKNENIAEEIAQTASIKLFLNYTKIDEISLNNWIYKVTKNLCMDYFRKHKQDKELNDELYYLDNLPHEEESSSLSNQELNLELYSFINKKDREILERYYLKQEGINELARAYKLKQKALKNKIYRLEQEIKLYHLIDSDVIYFKPVPATKLTKKINSFISSLVKALENNDLHSMSRYLKDTKFNDAIDRIHIKSYETCKLQRDKDDNYLLLIGYLDFEDKIKVFYISFTITEARNVQVIEFPILPKRVLVIGKEYCDSKTAEKKYLNKRGVYNQKLGTTDEMKAKGIATVIQTKDTF